MIYDLDLTFEIMMKSAEGATLDKELESTYLAIPELDDNQVDSPIISSQSAEEIDKADLDPTTADLHMGDRYWRKDVDLIEAVV